MTGFLHSQKSISILPQKRISGRTIILGLFGVATFGLCGRLGTTFYERYTLESALRPKLLQKAYNLADEDGDHFLSHRELRTLGIDLHVLASEESVPRGDLRERIRDADLESFRDYIIQRGQRLPEGCNEYFGVPCEEPYSFRMNSKQ